MAQQQIKGDTGALGADGELDTYQVPGSAVVTPYAVSANFDGTSAAGAFIPCLTFKTQTGAVIARCPAPEVAAGDSSERSWFPHVAGQAATASTGIPSGSVTTFTGFSFGPGTHNVDFNPAFSLTNAPATFSLDAGDNTKMVLQSGGQLRVDLSLDVGLNVPGPSGMTFSGSIAILDSLNNPVQKLTGPPIYLNPEESLANGSDWPVCGSTVINADDGFYTPPYFLQAFLESTLNVFVSYCTLFVAIENPAGLV